FTSIIVKSSPRAGREGNHCTVASERRCRADLGKRGVWNFTSEFQTPFSQIGLSAFALGAVLRPSLFAIRDALCVEDTADNVVAHAGEVANAAAADEHDRVLLQIVSLAGDVGGDLDPVGQPDTRHLA